MQSQGKDIVSAICNGFVPKLGGDYDIKEWEIVLG